LSQASLSSRVYCLGKAAAYPIEAISGAPV
jgi:hypothetical protein